MNFLEKSSNFISAIQPWKLIFTNHKKSSLCSFWCAFKPIWTLYMFENRKVLLWGVRFFPNLWYFFIDLLSSFFQMSFLSHKMKVLWNLNVCALKFTWSSTSLHMFWAVVQTKVQKGPENHLKRGVCEFRVGFLKIAQMTFLRQENAFSVIFDAIWAC